MATKVRRKRSSIFYETVFRAANFPNKFYYTAGVTIVPRNSNENFRSVRTAAPTLSLKTRAIRKERKSEKQEKRKRWKKDAQSDRARDLV